MSYYRRKSRGKGLRFMFQSFFDVSTSAASVQVLQWSVGGAEVLNRCRHLFGAYKYFKLGKISVKMVPASTLPVDPLQLSYDVDDPQSVDPRDQMNPGLVRITNGEDIFTGVANLTAEQQETMYKTMMLDPRWSKFMLQSGFRRSAYPLYWQVGQLSQDKYPGATMNLPLDNILADTVAVHGYQNTVADSYKQRVDAGSSPRGLFQVGHKGRLGYLPTDYYQSVPIGGTDARYADKVGINNIPEVSVITCVLPKAYKTLYYYRIFVTEEVYFAGLRSAPVGMENGTMLNGIDNFVMGSAAAFMPGNGPGVIANNSSMNNGDKLP